MKLILSVTSEQRISMGQDSRHVFGIRGGSIGRAQESDWVLPDKNLIVSKKHSIIECKDDGFFLTDISTNGVFLNDSVKPLGYNNAVRLHEGDSLVIGEYKIRVEMELSESFSEPLIRNDSLRSIDSVMCESAWQKSEKPEPLPLGLSYEDGLRLESRPALPKEWDSVDDGFSHPASQPDHTPAINDSFSMPAAHVEQLPEDWDKGVVKDDIKKGDDVSQQNVPSDVSDFESYKAPDKLSDFSPDNGSSHASVEAASQVSSRNDLSGINEFFMGAGVDPVKAMTENPKLTLEQLGRLYREMVQGVMDVLIARSSLKNEFRMPHTIVRATENNPLKFSMGVDDALEYLFFKKGDGFLQPNDAFEEAYQDIKEHQFATAVGMRAAFNSLLRMFEPERLRSKFKNGSKHRGLLSRSRSDADWEVYEEWYSDLIADTDDHFQQLFATEFGRAYEEEVERLASMRRKSRS
jgi:type VI secretion system protein